MSPGKIFTKDILMFWASIAVLFLLRWLQMPVQSSKLICKEALFNLWAAVFLEVQNWPNFFKFNGENK
jgi:hypothetical protein